MTLRRILFVLIVLTSNPFVWGQTSIDSSNCLLIMQTGWTSGEYGIYLYYPNGSVEYIPIEAPDVNERNDVLHNAQQLIINKVIQRNMNELLMVGWELKSVIHERENNSLRYYYFTNNKCQ